MLLKGKFQSDGWVYQFLIYGTIKVDTDVDYTKDGSYKIDVTMYFEGNYNYGQHKTLTYDCVIKNGKMTCINRSETNVITIEIDVNTKTGTYESQNPSDTGVLTFE